MFTGLVECTGRIVSLKPFGEAGTLTVRASRPLKNPVHGESIAVNGACLTLETASADGTLVFHTLCETLRRTNLEALGEGGIVNLERALMLGDRLGGHWVSGHVDCFGKVLECRETKDDFLLKIGTLPENAKFFVEKGSIAVDGVSLTVAECGRDFFVCRLIPVTLQETALRERAKGSAVNLEFDLFGKYVLRRVELQEEASASNITMDTLHEAGFL